MLNIYNNKEKIKNFLQVKGDEQKALFKEARIIRNRLCKNKVYVRAVLEVSNYCCCNCKFCGNAVYAKVDKRYRMTYEEIKLQVDMAKKLGLDVIHIASGEDKGFDFEVLSKSVDYIIKNNMYPELAVGKLDEKQYRELYKIGVRRFILKFETSDRKLFSKIKPCNSGLNELLDLVKELIQMGMQVGTGNIVGLPGQSLESIVDDLLLVQKLGVSMASTSVFIPNKESIFKNEKKGDSNIALNYIALLRCMNRNTNFSIPANSTFGQEGKKRALQYVANELSLNLTPEKYKNIYSIYEGKNRAKADLDSIKKIIADADCELASIEGVIYEKNSNC